MNKLFASMAILGLVLIAGLSLGCQKMGGPGGGDVEVITDLQDRVETLEADVEAIAVSLTELQDEYDKHMEEYHGTKPPERPPVRSGGGGGGVKPPTAK